MWPWCLAHQEDLTKYENFYYSHSYENCFFLQLSKAFILVMSCFIKIPAISYFRIFFIRFIFLQVYKQESGA